MPLPRVKKATLTAIEMHPQACLQDDFAWRVKMTPHMILLLPFLILGEKVRSASGRQIAPFYAPLRSALLVVCHWQTAPEPAGETVPRRGMSGNEGLGGTLPQKGRLGEESRSLTPPVTS